ncbi:unnamed protein product [Cyberlindnera jadinii]|uniref:Uncharacterized protein n=1 Tax=Cyberlindnera jadinii (strain ATCC 18201 / CBS 1600 / BCRC 20928 / JCM 3617 / NBRC 0987 / NRRL Y-1542) TaxID=983966 RepID=A0A0H5C8U9_CYBJN|nr:hypothetical protein CYBJADRAFT_168451 [Cyberlindnera jadinii NRRL Y-1542]ODV72519.1 hypothetical protein CYBJADRAFT_168451 [Cyberlindnera jadinii NRRL Y-1542]CEP24741.1 unnamed protein product [Cyberlindnera jadinii]
MSDRRPNPPGWVPPRAPYNPYDPSDKRPPQGYPSEFTTPGGHYNQLKETMKKLQYHSIPQSEIYPGQFKQLRRVQNYSKFYRGASLAVKVGTAGVVVYSMFIHKWEGDNVFSRFYQWRCRVQAMLFGINAVKPEDVNPAKQMRLGNADVDTNIDSSVGLQRPHKKHMLEAERRKQLEELQ